MAEFNHSYVVGERQRWSTGTPLSGEQDLRELSVAVGLACDGRFSGRFWTGHAGSVVFSRYVGVPLHLERTSAHLGDMLSGYIRLGIVLRGQWVGTQGSREFSASAGHVVANRYDEPWSMEARSSDIDNIDLFVPLSLVRAAGLDPSDVSGRTWKLSAFTTAAAGFISSVLTEGVHLDPVRVLRLDGVMTRIAMLLLDDLRDTSAAAQISHRDQLRSQVLKLIDAQFGDPQLTARAIADRLNVSQRSLFRAFEGTDTTVSELIRSTRLDRAASELSRPESSKTIAAVARSHGFSGADTFARNFQARFDESPSQFRNRVTGG